MRRSQNEQTGDLRLQKRGLTPVGGWVPYWLYDVYCVEDSAVERGLALGLNFRPVLSPAGARIGAAQIVIESTRVDWFQAMELDRVIAPIHGVGSEQCAVCGVRRWMPVGMDVLPAPDERVFEGEPPVVASPEWFGAGLRAFRQIVWRADVAEYLRNFGSKDFRMGHRVRTNGFFRN